MPNITWVAADLYYIETNPQRILNFKSIWQKTTEKSPVTLFLAKDNNSSEPNTKKVEINLYYIKTSLYITFQVNSSKTAEKSLRNLILAIGN